MVKLYYTPTSCGASSFIYANYIGLSIDCEIVDLTTHKTESGADFYTINKKGNVPCLVLDDGTILNENIACLQYISDQSELKYKIDSNENYLILQSLSYIASELHATIGNLFNKNINSTTREFIINNFGKKMKYLENNLLKDKDFLVDNVFTIADSYLHIVLSWTYYVGIDLNDFPIAKKYYDTICSLPFVQKAKNRMQTFPSKTY
jgi:glutathione S-transferase